MYKLTHSRNRLDLKKKFRLWVEYSKKKQKMLQNHRRPGFDYGFLAVSSLVNGDFVSLTLESLVSKVYTINV